MLQHLRLLAILVVALASDAADVRYSLTMLASELYALAQVAMLSFLLSLSIESYIHLTPLRLDTWQKAPQNMRSRGKQLKRRRKQLRCSHQMRQ